MVQRSCHTTSGWRIHRCTWRVGRLPRTFQTFNGSTHLSESGPTFTRSGQKTRWGELRQVGAPHCASGRRSISWSVHLDLGTHPFEPRIPCGSDLCRLQRTLVSAGKFEIIDGDGVQEIARWQRKAHDAIDMHF